MANTVYFYIAMTSVVLVRPNSLLFVH